MIKNIPCKFKTLQGFLKPVVSKNKFGAYWLEIKEYFGV